MLYTRVTRIIKTTSSRQHRPKRRQRNFLAILLSYLCCSASSSVGVGYPGGRL